MSILEAGYFFEVSETADQSWQCSEPWLKFNTALRASTFLALSRHCS